MIGGSKTKTGSLPKVSKGKSRLYQYSSNPGSSACKTTWSLEQNASSISISPNGLGLNEPTE